jgi:hypothetical protein
MAASEGRAVPEPRRLASGTAPMSFENHCHIIDVEFGLRYLDSPD